MIKSDARVPHDCNHDTFQRHAGPQRHFGADVWLQNQTARYKDEQTIKDIQRLFELASRTLNRLVLKSFRIPFITKSCHQCQYQGVWYICQCEDPSCEHVPKNRQSKCGTAPVCNQFVCTCCIQEHYSTMGISTAELQRICPACRGLCICRKHLREKTARASPSP